ncbi:MAG: hypothetical protein HFF11_06490 [Angelakisella sp.]|jgi:hypothetical protein|nr:hypothetical protein [Angelakisella sp.]
MKNHNIGLLGGGLEQAALANGLADTGRWEVYTMFLEGPLLSPKVRTARDFRDVLWLCGTLVLPHPVCREGLLLNAPLWQGPPVDAGQFLGSIGKGALLLAGEMTPAFSRAAAAKEVAVTPLPPIDRPEDWPQAVTKYLESTKVTRIRPRPRS